MSQSIPAARNFVLTQFPWRVHRSICVSKEAVEDQRGTGCWVDARIHWSAGDCPRLTPKIEHRELQYTTTSSPEEVDIPTWVIVRGTNEKSARNKWAEGGAPGLYGQCALTTWSRTKSMDVNKRATELRLHSLLLRFVLILLFFV